MHLFIIGVLIIIVGYIFYSKLIENLFGVDVNRKTCAYTKEDGIDYVPMKPWRMFLIQLLNIAGLGPIFGAIQGALFGPAAFIWIAFGTVFAGAVHDFFSGMISARHDGASMPEITGSYLGGGARTFMRVVATILLLLTGTVFMQGPAGILAGLADIGMMGLKSADVWLIIIFIYYFIATILPVDKIIGKIYPIFGAALLIMAIGVGGGMLFRGNALPAMTLKSLHPNKLPIWAIMFTTIACGAISGFHSTQSPIMARCMPNEKYGRPVFYGAMAAEGIIAMIWATAGMAFYGEGLEGIAILGTKLLGEGAIGPAGVVKEISFQLMGAIGGLLAVLGVVAAPITSGDTAFRSVRLQIADAIGYDQKPNKNRLVIAIPIFVLAFVLTRIDFNVIWRYFAFTNQLLATVSLWTASAFLATKNKNHWFTSIPAIFMNFVIFTYILQAKEGFELATSIAYPVGAVIAVVVAVILLKVVTDKKKKAETI